jgi:hypothetical protein
MADRFELSYVYSRVCGSLSRAFIGRRAVELARLGRITELWRVLFGESPPIMPEAALVAAAERRAVTESLGGFRDLAARLRADEPFFAALRRKTEFARVKRILLAVGGTAKPSEELPPSDEPLLEPGFNEAGFPDIGKMFANTRYAWIDQAALNDLPSTENRLDRQFYSELWTELQRLPRRKAGALPRLVREEIELENVVWALRLKRYYGMDRTNIEERLVRLAGTDVVSVALSAVSFRFDQRDDWSGWAWERLLEGGEGGSFLLDVRSLEAAAKRHLYRSVKRALHMFPFTYTPLYCYYKIKEYETAAVIGIIEGIHLGAPFEEMASFAAGLTGGSI